MTKEWFINIANFVTPSIEVIGLDCGHIGVKVNILNFLKILYSTLPLGPGQTIWDMKSKEIDDPKVCEPG